MISTWDGDEFHFLSYFQAFKNIMNNFEDYKSTSKLFNDKLLQTLSKYELDVLMIDSGFGYFRGSIPEKIRKMFICHKGSYLVCPSYDAMKEYLDS
jgi:hypothetical protein